MVHLKNIFRTLVLLYFLQAMVEAGELFYFSSIYVPRFDNWQIGEDSLMSVFVGATCLVADCYATE